MNYYPPPYITTDLLIESTTQEDDKLRKYSYPIIGSIKYDLYIGSRNECVIVASHPFTSEQQSPESPRDRVLTKIRELRGVPLGNEDNASELAILAATALIEQAEYVSTAIPAAEVDAYYGEVGIEWRNGNKIIRLTAFPTADAPPRLDFGIMSADGPGRYGNEPVATAQLLNEKMSWLFGAT